MTDKYEDLIRRLESEANDTKDISGFISGVLTKAAAAIRELVADYKGQGEALIREVNAKLEAQMRAEKAEADLAAARAALLELTSHTINCERELDVFHGLGSDAGSGVSDVVCRAIEAARRTQ